MKAIVQRVKSDFVSIQYEGIKDSFSGVGLVVLLGWEQKDEADQKLEEKEDWILSRCVGMRIFPDSEGKMNLSLDSYLKENTPLRGGILWVPQFTLAAELESGFRPSFVKAMKPELARERFTILKAKIRGENRKDYFKNESNFSNIFGSFGADMDLSFTNWGPVTIPLSI